MPRLGRIYSRNHKLLPRYTGLLKVYIYARPNIHESKSKAFKLAAKLTFFKTNCTIRILSQ